MFSLSMQVKVHMQTTRTNTYNIARSNVRKWFSLDLTPSQLSEYPEAERKNKNENHARQKAIHILKNEAFIHRVDERTVSLRLCDKTYC